MEKIKENVIFINKTKKNSWIESQATYYTNYICINEIRIRGNLEINILVLIRDRNNYNETSIFLEVYIKNDCEKENNYISFNFDYRDLEEEPYSFDDALLKAILKTVRIQTINAYKL